MITRDDGDDTLTISDHLDQTSAATALRLLREALDRRFDELDEFEDRNIAAYDLGPFFNALNELRKTKDTAHA